MKRKILHGSDHVIEKPTYGTGKKNNDYGLGFYCTENRELAMEWAVQENEDGFANHYTIKEDGLIILNLNSDDYSNLHWLETLLSNRYFDITTPLAKEAVRYLHENFHVDINEADIITGYRADDSYFSFAQDFINGTISYKQLSDALRLGDLGMQYVLKSKKAFEHLTFQGAELAPSAKWYPIKTKRDIKARRTYYQMDAMSYIKNDIYIFQILDQEIKADDPRLR